MSDVLGRAVIEVGVDDMRLQDEMQSTQSTITKSFNESLKRTKLESSERAKLANITRVLADLDWRRVKLADAQTRNTIKMGQTLKNHAAIMKQLLQPTSAELRANRGGKTISSTMPGYGDYGRHEDYSAKIRGAGAMAMAGIGGATALTFAGAAAAGSTTLDTLTGSLKMLSLVAGEKVQPAIMNISRGIQGFAKTMESAPSGAIGGAAGALTGGLIGARFGGLGGAAVGAGLGAAAGGLTEKVSGDFAEKAEMVRKLRANPEYVAQLFKEIRDYESKSSLNPNNAIEVAKRKGAIATFEHQVKVGKAMAAGVAGLGGVAGAVGAGGTPGGNGFKTAGLNMPMTMTGLASAYDQGNINMMGTSPLEIENRMREWRLNMKAMLEGARSRTSVDPNFVGPPQGN